MQLRLTAYVIFNFDFFSIVHKIKFFHFMTGRRLKFLWEILSYSAPRRGQPPLRRPPVLFFTPTLMALRALCICLMNKRKNSALRLPRCAFAHNILCSLRSLNTNLAVRSLHFALPNARLWDASALHFAKFGMLYSINLES